jgi:hypothetical protein
MKTENLELKKVIDAFELKAEVEKVITILKNDLINKNSDFECKEVMPDKKLCRHLGISYGSYLAYIFSLLKELENYD